ncbi:MAG: hypothetical protein AB8B56_15660 [Crocinitomicaceae bacterium]
MKQTIITLTLFLLSFTCLSQTNTDNDEATTSSFKSFNELLSESDIINNETFELKFLIRVLPDNGWYLQLHNDSSYEYIHWSAWGESDGTVLEKGEYEIRKNKIKLHSNEKKSELSKCRFYLLSSESNKVKSNITIDCAGTETKIYCLFKK